MAATVKAQPTSALRAKVHYFDQQKFVLWWTRISRISTTDPDRFSKNLCLTWLLGLFVMANLPDLRSVEIGFFAKMEKSIKSNLLKVFWARSGIVLTHISCDLRWETFAK